MLLRSTLLSDIVHGFSTRQGGVSEGRYASLNLGGKWGDDPAVVMENRQRLATEAGFSVEDLRLARQVHGRVVVTADGVASDLLLDSEADTVVASWPRLVPAVLTADCVPILISDGQGRVAAIHAGWRGTVARIVEATVAALVAQGSARSQLRAAIGPCICTACFEVGDEVAAQFDPRFVRTIGKAHIDLQAANHDQLLAAGVFENAIDRLERCTAHEPEWFFSFRRDGAKIGQMMSFIAAGSSATQP